jgi:hypothetical protein
VTTADQRVETLAAKLQALADRAAAEGGAKAKLARPLAEDADFIRKLKPSLIRARAKGEAPRTPLAPTAPQLPPRPRKKRPAAGGPSPWLVAGICLAAGIALAKWIDWRGHAHPRA